jgi:hypothetical protein
METATVRLAFPTKGDEAREGQGASHAKDYARQQPAFPSRSRLAGFQQELAARYKNSGERQPQ